MTQRLQRNSSGTIVILGVIVFLCCCTNIAFAEAVEGVYVKEIKNGCNIWEKGSGSETVYEWSRPCSDGFADGTGEMLESVGKNWARCNCSFKMGKLYGVSTCLFDNGERTKAEYRDGLRNGVYQIIEPDGAIMEREYKDDLLDGTVTKITPDGDKLVSRYANGRPLGTSQLTPSGGWPSHPNAIYVLGGKYERAGRYDRARLVYEYLISQHPETPAAMQASDRINSMSR